MSDPFELLARARPDNLDTDVDTTLDTTAATILTRVRAGDERPDDPSTDETAPGTRPAPRRRRRRDRAFAFAVTVSLLVAVALIAAVTLGRGGTPGIERAARCVDANPTTDELLDCLEQRVALIATPGNPPRLAIAAEGGYLIVSAESTTNETVIADIAGRSVEIPVHANDLATDLTTLGPNTAVAEHLTPALTTQTRAPDPTPGAQVIVVSGPQSTIGPLTLTATTGHVTRTFTEPKSSVTYIEVTVQQPTPRRAFIVDPQGRLLGIIEATTSSAVIAVSAADAALALRQ